MKQIRIAWPGGNVTATLEDTPTTRKVDPGTVCFWVEGQSLALPYGPTPISRGDECRLIAPVNILGKLDDEPTCLSAIQDGAPIRVEIV